MKNLTRLLLLFAFALPAFPQNVGGTFAGNGVLLTSGLTAGNAYALVGGAFTPALATTNAPAICLAISTTQCAYSGTWTTTGLTANATYYVSPTTAGAIQATIPYASGQYAQPIGMALSTTKLLIAPQATVAVNSPPTTPLFYFQCYGDSYCLGSGASNPAIGGVVAQLAKTIPSVPFGNIGVSGADSDAINNKIWTSAQPNPQQPSAYIMDGGANDGACGTSTGCVTNFKEEVNSSIGRLAIPNQERVMASNCTQTTGTWVADSSAYPIPSMAYMANIGTPMSTTSSGSVLTCTVTSRVASTKVGVNFLVANSQTGTFTVKVDGTTETDVCSASTTFTSAPCSGVNLLSISTTGFRQEFTGTSGTSHTVVITTTNAAKVDFMAADVVTPTPQPDSNYVVVYGPNAAFTNASTYDTAIGAVTAQYTADGALVAFADLQSTTAPGPGVNATTDISQTAAAGCTASANLNHPNDVCGYFHLAQTIVNATRAAGWSIFGPPAAFGLLTATGGSINGMIVNGISATTLSSTNIDPTSSIQTQLNNQGTITASGLTTGNVYANVSGTLTAAEGNSATLASNPAVCVAVSATLCRYAGAWTTTGLTAGATYYVSPTTAGAITTTIPATSGQYIQRIGVAQSTTVLLIQPSTDVGSVL